MRAQSQAPVHQRPLSNALLAMLGTGSQQVASLVIMLLAARFLPLSDYGTFMLAVVFVELATTLLHSGFYHYVLRSGRDDTEVQSSMFWIILAIGVLSGGTMVCAAPWIASAFQNSDLVTPLICLGALQPFAAVIAWASACLTRQERMRSLFICLAISNLGGLAAGVGLLLIWPSIYALLAYRACRVALGLAVFCGTNQIVPKPRISRIVVSEATSFSKGLYGTRLLEFLGNFGTDLLLALFFSTSESGLYRIANRLANAAIDMAALPLRNLALKSFAMQARRGMNSEALALDFLSINFLAAGIMAVMSIIFGPAFIHALLDPSYALAIPAFYVLCLRGMALFGHRIVEPIFAAQDLNLSALRHNSIWTGVFIATTACLAPFGLLLLSIGQLLVAVGMTSAAILLMQHKRVLTMRGFQMSLFKSLAIFAFVLCTALLFQNTVTRSPLEGLFQVIGFVAMSLLITVLASQIAMRWGIFSAEIFDSR